MTGTGNRMRFKANGPAIPDVLLDERDAGNVVFLCGAGVSIEAGMPEFKDLAQHVVGELDPPQDSEIRRALQTYDADEDSTPVGWRQRSLDEVFQMLYDDYRPEQVAESVWRKLSKTREAQPHHTIARLSANTGGHPQIVTTNFDHLFETAIGKEAPRYEAPAFPDLRRSPKGITYLHGRLADSESGPHNYILSSSDLGRAYLAEGWAAGFVRELLQRYTVVLLGYQAEDPPLRYLLQGLDSAGKPSWDRLFAFDKGDDEHVRAKWSGRNVRAIPYNGNKHDALWETLEAWAERADNPAEWRNAVVERSGAGPRALEPHERGMIAHVVKTATGAKQFADQDPVPSAEWLCVFDASYRYAMPKSGIGSSLQPSDPLLQPFDPLETYGLDDDPPRPSGTLWDGGPQGEDLISWRRGDESADRWQGLSRRPRLQPAPLPPRLFHLARWLVSRVTDPVLAWWVARQPALHPQLHQMLKSTVEGSPSLTDDARRGWMVLLEALESRAPHPVDVDLHHLPKRIGKHGWRAGLIREFEALTEPVFEAGPPRTLREPQPPSGDWSDVKWRMVADIRIRFPSQTVSWPTVPDDNLPSVYAALERNLLRVCARTQEASEIGWEGADVRPDSRDRNAYVSLFRETLDRLARRDDERVKRHIALWPDPDPHFFDRLRLDVWGKASLFSGTEVVDHVLALSDEQFWRDNDRRELMSLLHGRWDDTSAEQRRRIGQRILDGPPRAYDENETRRQATAASCLGWLIQNDCALPDDLVEQWKTLKGKMPGWDDSWVNEGVSAPMALGVGDVETNEDTSVLDGVPVGDIVRVALENSGRISLSVVNEPFTGLVKTRPGRAIRALGAAARRGEFSAYLWSLALRHWPDTAPRRATRALHGHLRRLTAETIVAMPNPIGEWLEKRFPDLASEDRIFAVELFDHLVESLSTAAPEGLGSGPVRPTPASRVPSSRPTLLRAVNAPIGKAVRGLIEVLSRDKPEECTELPEDLKLRFERLLSAGGEGADDAVCVLSSRIAWLNWIDPSWVDTNMIPWFHPDHERTEPAWNGILSARTQWSIRPHFDKMKEGFLALPNAMYEWGWREKTQKYSTAIVELVLFSRTGEPGLSFEDARRCLRRITAADREHVIWFLGRVGAENDDGWRTLVMPFIRKAWPRERRCRTSGTSGAWLSLLCHTGDAFPDLLAAVRDHLGAVDWRHAMLSGLEPLVERFPRQTLDLLARVAPDGVAEAPYGLSQVLDLLAEARPDLISDPRYRRLHRLAARE
ncbi:MAG: hypothetical protein F4Z65_05060 [Acidobacteria bacterium]|nr:hypothetical protein [Acidobacteriota bacterium]MYI39848.1 hypothetical protein [Acidobacteriota bacterium]